MKFIYLSKPANKNYDFDSILNYTQLALEEVPDIDKWEIDEVYADGWAHVPNGIDDLLADAKANKSKVTGIVLYSLEEITIEQLTELINLNKPIYCILAKYVDIVQKPKAEVLLHIKRARKYYSNLTSMKIRHGVKASNKLSGAAPFGYERRDGELVQNEDYPTLQEIVRLHNASVSVSEIARRVNMNSAQIYGILRTVGGRK